MVHPSATEEIQSKKNSYGVWNISAEKWNSLVDAQPILETHY